MPKPSLLFKIFAFLLLLLGLSFLVTRKYQRFSPATARVWGPSNPFIYDNDEVVDTYTDGYILALAANREISLRGLITSCSIQPYNHSVSSEEYERMARDRQAIVDVARASGLKNIPDPIRGPKGNLNKPLSGRIEDTQTIGSAGSWLIVNEARKADVRNPLVIVVGGPITAEADAYLLDPSIADKMIILWDGAGLPVGKPTCLGQYNAWADGWAANIALQRLRLVFWSISDSSRAYIPKTYLKTLPGDSALRTYLINQDYPKEGLPGNYDGDGAPAISVMRGDYSTQFQNITYTGRTKKARVVGADQFQGPTIDHEVPKVRRTSRGHVLMTNRASGTVATNEWRRAVERALSESSTPTSH